MKEVGTKHGSRVLSIVGLALVFLFSIAGISALAQISSGTILGTVLDPSNAAIPGATVTLLNTQTGLTRTTTSDAHGAYRFSAVPTGVYTVKVEKTGFRTLTRPDVTLTVAQSLVVNATLEVGSTQQQVVVTGAPALVNTTTTTLGGLVNDASIAQLPLNGRNYTTLALIQPGVTQNFTGTGAGQSGVWYSSNGASIRSNYATLDGTPIMNELGGSVSSELGTSLGVDGIKEFRVITTGFGAQYGMAMGSQMVLVSKGGTNHFHGDAYDYLRNSAMDAANYFDNPAATGGKRLPEFQRNDFGGSIGGPIRKNKTFFYGVFEGVRQNLGVSVNDVTIPAACHTANHVVDNSCISTLASGQTLTVAPAIQPLLALYPSPNVGTDTYAYGTTAPSREYYGQMRVDQNISSTDMFFARYTVDNAQSTSQVIDSGTQQYGGGFPYFRNHLASRYQFLTLSENHIYSPTLLGVTHLSYARTIFRSGTAAQPGGTVVGPGGLTVPASGLIGPDYSFVPGNPVGTISIAGFTNLGAPSCCFGPPDATGIQNVYTLREDIHDTIGNHALAFGALINRFNDGFDVPFFTDGSATFTSLSNFILGKPAIYESAYPVGYRPVRNYWFNTFGFYLEDNWHAMPRLTLNVGLRYEFRTTPVAPSGDSWAIRNRYTDATSTQGPPFVNDSLHDFSPRLGFAWDVFGNGKTAVRGAWGLYYDVASIGTPLQQSFVLIPPDTRFASVINPASFSVPLAYTSADIGPNIFTNNYNLGQPKGMQYSLTVEHQLPGQVALSVAYVGFHGMSLYQDREGNPVIPTSVTGFGPNPVEYWDPSIIPGCANRTPTCRLNPNFTTWSMLSTYAFSWYNSLQITGTKRLGHGLEFNTSYTWSKSLDNVQSAQNSSDCLAVGGNNTNGVDPLLGQTDYGPSCFDRSQVWNLSMMYHFPNIQSHNFAAKILHGWWVGNIVSVMTGLPTSPFLAKNRSCSDGCGSGAARPSIGTGAATVTIGGKTYNFVPFNKSSVTTGNPTQWFNPLMFMLQPPGYLGTAHFDMLRGPHLGTWDFSVVKDTALPFLGEGGNVEFRAEFFNILNHPNFSLPSSAVFTGALSDTGAYSEAPLSSAGRINSTVTTSRQIQLALKIIF
ncbi:MAG TPA: TonB-dependent receptor [Patescibacteria group bacterium]|nr:TonB-dependent receptor [Patescibacteria group bacterium]